MASLISGFEYDIFISYRQKDNKGNRWVTEIVNTPVSFDPTLVDARHHYIDLMTSRSMDKDEAFLWLDKSFRDHEMEMFWLKVEPTLRSLHPDLRWAKLMEKMPFPKTEQNQ